MIKNLSTFLFRFLFVWLGLLCFVHKFEMKHLFYCNNLFTSEHIQESFRDGVINGRVRSMPNSFLPPNPMERPGVLVLGDAYNMRHPLTGGGMSVCLNDVVIWRQLLQGIPDFTDYASIINALRVFHLRRKNNHSFVVNVLAQALYELFAAENSEFPLKDLL